MTIEITSRRKIKSPNWATILMVFCLILFLGLTISYFYLNSLVKKINQEIEEKENTLIATPSEKALENNLFLAKNKIDAFADLIPSHRNPVNIFTFLENACLSNVQFSSFDFDAEKNIISVSGITDDFISIERQVHFLKQEVLAEKIEVSGISIDKEKGAVNFTFLINLGQF